jgi:putative cell wall-binding protein
MDAGAEIVAYMRRSTDGVGRWYVRMSHTARTPRGAWFERALSRAMMLACVVSLCLPAVAHAVPRAFGLAVGMQPLSLSSAALAATPPGSGSRPVIHSWVDPVLPNGYFGWRVTVTTVMLFPDRPSILYYRWGSAGQWKTYAGPLIVPEGKQTLYAFAVDDTGRAGAPVEMPFKLDYRSPVSRGRPVTPSAPVTDGTAVTVVARRAPSAGPRVVRLHGPSRYGTSAQIAEYNFPSASYVVVARGDDFPDALAASGLAGIHRAPILLAGQAGMPPEIVAQIQRLGAKHAIIVGSTRAVPAKVESQLKSLGLVVERIGGVDRYDTAALISRAVVARGGTTGKAFVARGDLFPDSLAMSPAAYNGRVPIMLVHPKQLPAATRVVLSELRIKDVVIAGSERAVSPEVAAQVGAVLGAGRLRRVAGPDRYGTAAAAADFTVASGLGSYTLIGVATGENFPDALCGGAALVARSGVLVLTRRDSLPPVSEAILAGHGDVLREVQVYGSEIAISAHVWDQILTAIR